MVAQDNLIAFISEISNLSYWQEIHLGPILSIGAFSGSPNLLYLDDAEINFKIVELSIF